MGACDNTTAAAGRVTKGRVTVTLDPGELPPASEEEEKTSRMDVAARMS